MTLSSLGIPLRVHNFKVYLEYFYLTKSHTTSSSKILFHIMLVFICNIIHVKVYLPYSFLQLCHQLIFLPPSSSCPPGTNIYGTGVQTSKW